MITHDYKLIFVHIPKCAGRSISEIFNQRFDQFTAGHYEREYPKFWPHYKRFAIIRNPYARLVSMYYYIQNHRRHRFEPIACDGAPFDEWLRKNLEARGDSIVNLLSPEAERGTDGDLGSRHWFTAQAAFLNYCPKNFDLFRLEHGLNETVLPYLQNLGVPVADIPRVNTTKHENWERHYTRDLLELVNKHRMIREDLAHLGYQKYSIL